MDIFPISVGGITVTGIHQSAPRATALLVLGHGAGAGMRHAFMEALADRLVAEGLAVLRYQFPYAEAGKRRPDPEPLLLATVRAALAEGARRAGSLPLFGAGKSMGGRMTARALAAAPDAAVRGLVFFGFPLHQAGKPSVSRAEHLQRVAVPLLFLQGTRDTLADLTLIRQVTGELGPRAELAVIAGADHGFGVLKSSGRTAADVLAELATRTAAFCAEHSA